MDVWPSASQHNDFIVYLGLWTNWSQGRIMGSTLIITKSNGALVIAFAAFFVTIIATRFWRMACVVTHRVYCRPGPELHDVVYHHRQAILRNSPSAISGLWSFIRVILAHRTSTTQLFIRVSPILLFSLLCIGSFSTLTYFLPQITASMSDQVLLVGDLCGHISARAAQRKDFNKSLVTVNPYLSSQISDAENYAQQCYSGSSQALQCSTFVSLKLKLDTGFIDLNKYIGVNSPINEDLSEFRFFGRERYNDQWLGVSPYPILRRDDADTLLVFLSGAGVYFIEPSPDPWYRATTLAINRTIESLNNFAPAYLMDEAASPLGCAIQWQFCQTAPSETPICGDLASFNDATSSFLANTEHQNNKLYWYLDIFYNAPGIWDVLDKLHTQSLLSQRTLNSDFQSGIAENQWQLDVSHWWATTLAAQQASFVNTVNGPPDIFQIPRDWIRGPMDDLEREACHSQKVRSAAHSSFNMFGLAFFFVAGSLIIIASLALEPLLAALHNRWGYRRYAYLEWVSQETLQLQRLAHEQLGFGTWSGATNTIPTTKLDEKLAGLDLTDPKHPRLRTSMPRTKSHTSTASDFLPVRVKAYDYRAVSANRRNTMPN
ncbi:hypothetical protein NUW58_g1310 [Xylaria curta]|uniref:Uncharacterized protein n=1 Tax=Xylaria curta TaxID=42375 RepID=A0ACC1PKU4_9PEZI|nr:hypothetical protein NUW58_g1310 [Xylaria curta]